MLQFFQNNAGTLIIGAVVLAVVVIIIYKMIADKRRGKSAGCGCGCSECALSGSCHVKTEDR